MRAIRFFLLGWIALAMMMPYIAQAQSADDIPLVVIRYNQPRVYYDKQLYNAISKAVAIKPDLTVSVVSFVPAIGDESTQERYKKAAQAQRYKLVQDLKGMGIPENHLNVTTEYVDDARFHEIYVYVD